MAIRSSLLIAAWMIVLTVAQPAGESDEGWWDAVLSGDLKTVQRLIEQGIDVNSKTKYGASALHFASDKGHLEVVRFLLEKGAEVNLADSFYRSTPIAWAIMKNHLEIAALLAERGADGAEMALRVAVARRSSELAKAVLAGKRFKPEEIRAALEQARRVKAEEIVALLETVDLPEAAPQEEVKVEESTLRGYQGHYRNQDRGLTVELKLSGGRLTAIRPGQPTSALAPISESEFQMEAVPGMTVTVQGRGGMVEALLVKQGSSTFRLEPYDPSAPAEDSLGNEPTAADGTVAEDEEKDDQPPEAAPRTAPQTWPSFRGRNASGVADGQGAPLSWSVKDGKNIRWKAAIEGLGNSSPIVWGDRIFVTTGVSSAGRNDIRTGLYGDVASVDDLSEHTWKVICLNKSDGRVLWQQVAARGIPQDKRHTKSTLANPTPATDGRRVVAVFPSQGLFCYDTEGKPLWKADLGRLDSGWFFDKTYQWGFSSSPVIYRDSVIVQIDIQGASYIAAFRLSDGKQLWKTDRDEIPTWSTPSFYLGAGRDEVITNGTTIRAYDPSTGRELWHLGPNSEIVVATPIVGEDLIFLTAGYPPVRPVYAVRPGASGDISLAEGQDSNSSIAWSYDRGGTYIPSPLLYRGRLYTLANDGRLTCYDAKSGETIYRARVGRSGSFSASPIAADGKLYFTSESGQTYVATAGPKYRELAVNDVGETVMTTPAVSDGLLVIRALNHVFGIGE